MKPSGLLEIMVLVAVLLQVARSAKGIKGEFDMGDLKCTYYEESKSGPGPRTMVLTCNNTKEGYPDLNCAYRGNPHPCRAYINGGQPKFYKQIAIEAASRSCESKLITAEICANIDFTREYGDELRRKRDTENTRNGTSSTETETRSGGVSWKGDNHLYRFVIVFSSFLIMYLNI